MCKPGIAIGCGLLFSALVSAQSSGIRPRPSSQDYPVEGKTATLSVGASTLSGSDLRTRFVADLNKRYIVVEVAVYPAAGSLNVSPEDFTLKAGDRYIRPAEPAVVASSIHPRTPSGRSPALGGREIDVTPTAEIAHESYPVYGQDGKIHNQGAWITGTGVAVSGPVSRNGAAGYPTDPDRSDRDRAAVEAELADKSLPEARISQPVAGYLYFPEPAHFDKKTVLKLQYSSADATESKDSLTLQLPPAASK